MFVDFEDMLRSKPPKRGDVSQHRTMTGDIRKQIQAWEGAGSKNDESSRPFSSPNVVLRSTIA